MKLHEYIYVLNKMVKEDPSLLELEVYAASNNEGNSYNRVNWCPSVYYQHKHDKDSMYSELDEADEIDDFNKVLILN